MRRNCSEARRRELGVGSQELGGGSWELGGKWRESDAEGKCLEM